MKNFKIIASLLCLFVCFAFVSCDSNSANPSDDVTETEDTSYKCTLKYADGTPVSNVKIQWCNSVTCFQPVSTDENGVAKNTSLVEGNYGVHLYESDIPAGYTYDPNGHDVTPENRNVEITLVAVNEYASGNGEEATPYAISEGYYAANISEAGKRLYFKLTVAEAGTYQIRSLALEKFATNPMSVVLRYDKQYGSSSKTNFKLEVALTAGQSIDLQMMVITPQGAVSETNFPADFSFQVTKK